MTQFCTNCGAPIPEDARFCPRCGAAVAVAAVEPVPPVPPPQPAGVAAPAPLPPAAPVRPAVVVARQPSRSGLIVGVIIALVALGLVAWALLAGMPFGHRSGGDDLTRATTAQPDVVSEDQGSTSTVSQIGEPAGSEDRTVTTSTTSTMMQPPMSVPMPMPSTTDTGAPPPLTPPASPTATAGRSLSEDEAANIVRGYVTSTNYYQTTTDCIGIAPLEFVNGGYTIDVVDRCGDRGRLGRWRVDSVTREVFVRRADGRYLRP